MTDLIDQYLLMKDLLGFIQAMYTVRIGEMIYVLWAMLIAVPIYMRTQSLTYISIVSLLFAGIVWVALPASSLHLTWVFLILGITGLIFKAFR